MQVPQQNWERTIDLSGFNNDGHPIDFETLIPELRSAGYTRALTRATYGSGYEDPQFAYNWGELKRLNFPRGAYHAAVPGALPNLDAHAQEQSAFFLSVLNREGGIQGGDWPILDLEQTGSLAPDELTLWASHWLACVDAAVRNSNNRAIFYSYVAFIQAHIGIPDTLASRPLWLADYPGGANLPTDSPPNVGAWTSYQGWQFSDGGSFPAVSGAVDLSVWDVPNTTSAPAATPTPGPVTTSTPPAGTATVAQLEAENTALKAQIAQAQKVLGE